MSSERCPSCGAAVRAGDPWCTLCWADLRPKPAPPPPPVPAPAPVPATVAAPAAAPPGVSLGVSPGVPVAAAVDPLTAPLGALLGQPLAADPGAPANVVTWPCVECGTDNALDLDACSVCSAPFGGRIARLDDPKGVRRKFLMYGLGAVGAFLLLLAMLTFALTDATTTGPGAGGGDPFEPSIDYSQLPQE